MSDSDPAYEIVTDPSHLGDDDYDAQIVPFPNWEMCAGLILKEARSLPVRVYFEANFDTLKVIDYPINNAGWPLMSERMRRVLSELGEFSHREIPVTMLDDTVPTAQRLDASGNPRPGVAMEGFAGVQMTEHLDAFDWERSRYKRDDDFPEQVRLVRNLVLKDVPLPPLFRLAASPRSLFVSAAARAALEKAEIRGVQSNALSQVF